ncbi:MAG: alpha-glucuronidase family glycosyl hydrolase [Oceanipulchritudo sp.]
MEVPQKIPLPLDGDENGYEAWLNYRRIPDEARRQWLGRVFRSYSGPVGNALAEELESAVEQMTGQRPQRVRDLGTIRYILDTGEFSLGEEGYSIRHTSAGLEIRAEEQAGFLYATFFLLGGIQQGLEPAELETESRPFCPIRMLNHWDDPKFDHTIGPYNVTRGFAGNSIFHWDNLSEDNPRYRDYARLLASIGINAVCLNNVNADPDVIESGFLPGIQAMANRLRPYNIRVFLAVPFTAPMVCDGTIGKEEYGADYPFCMRNRKVREGTLATADPLDPRVQQWWKDKAEEIYGLIPDFGGFVIKANSEGMPGPQDYGRSHAEGANCLARALAPHGGVLFYRTFVYQEADKTAPPNTTKFDGVCQPFLEFKPLDGAFDGNVILQTKSGPADFRAHEPPSPLLGAVPHTRQAVEFMIAQEYLGQTTHVCFQGKDWHRILNFDTHQAGPDTTVAAVVSGKKPPYRPGAIVGVANIGDDPNWFGHLFAGANLYAFGKLAWNPEIPVEDVVREWITRTLGPSEKVASVAGRILDRSYEIYSRYTVPFGINYMFERNHHFEPRISSLSETSWDSTGVGTDRTIRTGTKFIGQYHPDAARQWEDPETTPIEQLLFFHKLPWNYRLRNGKTLESHIVEDRIEAVEVVREWLKEWRALREEMNPQAWAHVYERLQRQYVHAGKWRDAGIAAVRRVRQKVPGTVERERQPAVAHT